MMLLTFLSEKQRINILIDCSGMAPKLGTEICAVIRFSSTYRLHRYRCHIGNGFWYPTLTITTTQKSRITHCGQRNPNNLRTLPMSANTLLSYSIGLWNCQSAVNKANLITSIISLSRINIMALTEMWIKPGDTATPAALSNNFSFFHTPRPTGTG